LKKATSLKTLFMRKQISIFIGVIFVTGIILTTLLSTFAQFIDEKRLLLLAQSIESQAHIAKSPLHLQHAINRLVFANRAKGIYVFSKDNQIIAASGGITPGSKHHWVLSDTHERKMIAKKIRKGLFGLDFQTDDNNRITILPLSPILNTGFNNSIHINAKWPTPEWHKIADIPEMSPILMLNTLLAKLQGQYSKNFQLPQSQFSGAIVIESSYDWITSLLVRTTFLIAVLMIAGVLIVSLTLSRTLKRYILDNITPFSDVINARKDGNLEVRIKKTNVQEFDELATQWNSLLDYRQVAQSQSMVLSSLLEHVPVGIEVSDANSYIEYANPEFLKITGLSLVNVIGKTIDDVLKVSNPDSSVIGNALVALSNGESWSGEITTIRPDESEMHCNITVVPVYGEDNTIDRIVTLYHDITDIKDNENELVSARVSAELADKAKSEFIANMSHELRTPLNAIIGFSEMMAAEKMGPLGNKDYVEFSTLIENSSRSLLLTINTILELSRLDADVHKLDQQAIYPSRVIDKVINTKIDKARALGVEITRNLKFGDLIHTDERLLRQSISYLICNAIRYNKPNGGTVDVSSSLNKNNQLVISIKDNGIGISQTDIEHIMSPFHRVDNALDRMNNGAGLGLTLVKKFSVAQGIDLTIDSQLGVGTTATLTFCGCDTLKRNPKQKVFTNNNVAQAQSA